VQINNIWYDVREGWAGKLELHQYMKNPEYFANETNVDGVYFVSDSNGYKIGEFDMRYMDCKGKAYRLLNCVPQYRFIELDTSTDIPNYHRKLCLPSGYTAGKGNRFNRPSMARSTKNENTLSCQ
jgi:hypothetical protein